MNIKLIKFANGEEIIAEVLDDAVTFLKITNAIRIMIMPPNGPGGKPAIGFSMWVDYVQDKTYQIAKSHILFYQDPLNDLVTEYKSVFSRVAMPKKPAIII